MILSHFQVLTKVSYYGTDGLRLEGAMWILSVNAVCALREI